MNKFNLTFRGEIQAGKDPEQVKIGLGKLLEIDDQAELQHCFSGDTVILRRNLDRKTAADFYSKLAKLGATTKLVKVSERALIQGETDPSSAPAVATKKTATAPAEKKRQKRGMDQEILHREQGQVDQSWAVGSRPAETARPGRKSRLSVAAPKKPRQADAPGRKADLLAQKHLPDQDAAVLKAKEHVLEQALRAKNKEQKLQEAEQVLRRRAELTEEKRKQTEQAARIKAEQERQRAEEDALNAELAEARRKKAEKAARRKAEQERQQAKAAAQREAKLAEEKRKKAEEAARIKAEEAARIKAEQERRKAEEAALRKAKLAEERRKKAEEAARVKAEQERRKAEEAARRKAKLAEEKRRKAEEAAHRKAEQERRKAEEAAHKAELAEQRRKQAEEAARAKAEQAEKDRQEAALKARLQAELEEKARLKREQERRQAAEEAAAREAQKEQEKRQAAERAAAQKAENAERKRKQAEDAARRKAQEKRKRELEAASIKAAEEEQAAQRKAMEEQAIRRAAAELALKPAPGAAAAAPQPPSQPRSKVVSPSAGQSRRKRQPGEPNLYSLQPFRNTAEIKTRAENSERRMKQGFTVAILALVALLFTGALLLGQPSPQKLNGASLVAVDPQGKPVLLAGDHLLLHDRAGIAVDDLRLAELGLASARAPLAFNSRGDLFVVGQLAGEAADALPAEPHQLLRCQLSVSRCEIFSAELARTNISGLAVHPLDGTVFVADAVAGQLLKLSELGIIIGRAETAIAERPVLRLDSGLLLMNSKLGPAISVFRYEDSAFGKQLDEILLVLPPGLGTDYSGVSDFVLTGDSWWITLSSPAAEYAGVYRFDSQWKFIERVALAIGTQPEQLANWGQKTLVRDSRYIAIQRFNNQGLPEAPFASGMLADLLAARERAGNISTVLWRGVLTACALLALIGCFIGSLNRVRALVYKTCKERGAEPIDERAASIDWIAPDEKREASLKRISIAYALIALALLLVAVGLSVSAIALSALLLALCGPAAALVLLHKSPPGHMGTTQGQLLLVDHNGMYHLGGAGRIQYRGHFLMIDDVAVFTGTGLLPAFSAKQVKARITPLARDGIKVDRRIILAKLLESRHPLAVGAVLTLATSVAALALLSFQGIF